MQDLKEWYITNRFSEGDSNTLSYSPNLVDVAAGNEPFRIFIDGYIIPRVHCYEEFKCHSQQEMIRELYLRSGKSFVHSIKGIFTLIFVFKNEFMIFSNRTGIKKYFVYKKEDEFFISNSLRLISSHYSLEIDTSSAATFLLFSHFIADSTLFKHVCTAKAGGITEYNSGKLTTDIYWEPGDLLKKRSPEKYSFDYYASYWLNIIKGYCNFLKPAGVSVTLTGGNDSRMILAALLKTDHSLRGFTYGNPDSHDGVISDMIRKSTGLEHKIHFVSDPSDEWFWKVAQELIKKGGSLINIHRAHRYDAAKKESLKAPAAEMIFTGLLGGELLKEPRYDDKVIPSLFEQLDGMDSKDASLLIEKHLKIRGVNPEMVDLKCIYERILLEIRKGHKYNCREKKFIYTWYFYGSVHHSQDSNVFGMYYKYVVNPFMDIDYLEVLAKYQKWYMNRGNKLTGRLFHSELIIGITDKLAPELSDIPYAKKGEYTAKELLNNKMTYLLGRLFRYLKKDQKRYPRNFPMGDWLYKFNREKIERFPEELAAIIDPGFLKESLESCRGKVTEGNWHIVTNPVNLSLIYEQYT